MWDLTGTATINLLSVHAVHIPVKSVVYHFWILHAYCTDHIYWLCRRATRTHEFKLQGSYKGLKQASRLCECGVILMMTELVQSGGIFPVSDYTQFAKNCQETLLWLRIRVKHNLTLTLALNKPQLTLSPLLAINRCIVYSKCGGVT